MINRCLQVAVEEGFYMTSNQERGGITDILLLFRKLHTFSDIVDVFWIFFPSTLHCYKSKDLSSGGTLSLNKISSTFWPPFFSLPLATTLEATRKYSQVSLSATNDLTHSRSCLDQSSLNNTFKPSRTSSSFPPLRLRPTQLH